MLSMQDLIEGSRGYWEKITDFLLFSMLYDLKRLQKHIVASVLSHTRHEVHLSYYGN